MPFIRMPSKALIDALGWDAVQEIDALLDHAAEELRAERRRLEAARLDAACPARGEAHVLWRLADMEYELRLELGHACSRLERQLAELTQEVSRLRSANPPPHHNPER